MSEKGLPNEPIYNECNALSVRKRGCSIMIKSNFLRISSYLLALCVMLFVITIDNGIEVKAGVPKKILIIVPHEDDEVLQTAGIIKKAVESGDSVKVVVATNGDYGCDTHEVGETRIRESISAMEFLGLQKEDIVFLGYGDTNNSKSDSFLRQLYDAQTSKTVIGSQCETRTYGIAGEAPDYHYQVYQEHGLYNRQTFRMDVENILRSYKPTDIYVTSVFDTHYDHSTLYMFAVESIINVKREDMSYAPALYETIIHATESHSTWPSNLNAIFPSMDLQSFDKPSGFDNTALDWNERISVPVPACMQVTPIKQNPKYIAIGKYTSQVYASFLYNFTKSDEIFWKREFSNIAPYAEVTVSSEEVSTGQAGVKAIDGIRAGNPLFIENEWVTHNELNGAWIKLSWQEPHTVNKIILFDRPNTDDQILSGTLTFSDGSSISIDALKNRGTGDIITFEPRSIEWVKLTINQAKGKNIGLSEIEVHDTAAPLFNPMPTLQPIPVPSPSNDNVALNKNVTASSVEVVNTFEGSFVNDGDDSTRWSSQHSDNQWICVDLGSTMSINRVKINWEAAYASKYKIQVSNDNSNWTDVFSTIRGNGGIDDIIIPTTEARYVKVQGIQRATQYGYSIWEIQVFQ